MVETEAMSRLVAAFRKLPGVGAKTAQRYAYSMLEMDGESTANFIQAIKEAKERIVLCSVCGNYCENGICKICSTRDKTTICVVGEPKDINAFEKMGGFEGVYHVLHGTLDFQKGIGVEDIRIKELASRLAGVKEVIIATNPDVSGELTASYLAGMIKPLGIKVSRLAYGISVGSEIEYADELTLQRALQDRKEL
ncbi:MAG: recombination mediator RecR [Clostridia bacterium]|nr:recombination mediator RecR [Clostridia bacterium]